MPRDAATGEYQPAEARLAASTDDQTDRDEATPIARDEPFFFADRQEYTDEPARADIDDWTTEYDANPLLKRPIQLFTDDIFEPGYETAVRPTDPTQDVDSYEEPTVPTDYPNAQYHGLALSDALDRWLGRCGITADSFAKDATVVFKQALRDAYGRRGTGLVEHAYADPRERRRLVGLRPFQVDDVTAYTRAGKAILLRPDDDAESLRLDDSAGYEARRAPTLGLRDRDRDDIPTTMAGKTAAFVQYDDVYGTSENEEIALALDDVTMYPRDPDTGAVFGRPDTATVVPRATAIREIYQDVDQGVKNAAWNSIVANVNTDNQEEAKKMLSGLDPNNPESVSVTNTDPDIEVIDGQTPDVVNLIQQQVEYVISALPVSLYRVGFEGEINRDVTGEQSDDYADALSSARGWVESQARGILEQKACEFLTGHAHPEDVENPDAELYGDPSDVPDVALRIRPDKTSDPLRSEHFDAEAFAALIQGLKQAAPGGQVSQLVTGRAIVDLVPGWDPDEVMPGAAQEAAEMGALAPLDEADPDVREQFAASMGLPAPETATNGEAEEARLANRYSEGDIVDTPAGIGVVAAAISETVEDDALAETENVPDRIDASPDSPMYGVVTENAGQPVRFYKASELSMAEIDSDVDPFGTVGDEEAEAACPPSGEEQTAELAWSPPESWRESDTPARLIALDAFSSMGGKHGGSDASGGCVGTMQGKVADADGWCAGFIDYVYGGYDFWRGDSFLPGD
jgi:hypothetical protein